MSLLHWLYVEGDTGEPLERTSLEFDLEFDLLL